ncbi:MAG: zinc ribbon domain-containing protein [Nitrospirota bacterium]|nr:zinc ribbon domain-containing protein [Nitrospirota bacterium]
MIFPLVIGMLLGAAVGVIAEQKNRPFFPWALYGFFLFFFAIIHIAVIGDKAYEDDQLKGMAYKKCPACAEMVKNEAVFCKHCKTSLSPEISRAAPDVLPRPCRWCKQDLVDPEVNKCPSCGGLQRHFLKDNPMLMILLFCLMLAFFVMLNQAEVEVEAPSPSIDSFGGITSLHKEGPSRRTFTLFFSPKPL